MAVGYRKSALERLNQIEVYVSYTRILVVGGC